jgi:hypothetical protein|tara:strand:+ start:655 stop:1659 length:1005 start_codon:yes stop_codon:yes gene_type:complete
MPTPGGSYSGIWKIKNISKFKQENNWPPNFLGSDVGLFAGGNSPDTQLKSIDYINIPTTGNAAEFGEISVLSNGGSGVSSSTRGVFGIGSTVDSTGTNAIEFVNFSVRNNSVDFGDLLVSRLGYGASAGSSTRGVFAGAELAAPVYGTSNIIQYITIASEGNALDFGDLASSKYHLMGTSSSTRGVFAGGNPGPGAIQNTIEYVTIASTGNSSDFGDLLQVNFRGLRGSIVSSGTRGIFAGGSPSPSLLNVIQFITIASTGNATDFGDLTEAKITVSGTSNSTRGVFAGGATPTPSNVISYITIGSTGNATDFGDLRVPTNAQTTASNSSGNLS